MNTREMEIFQAVAKELSFARAAESLYISQSAVTQCIKRIEVEIGFSLFERDKHHVALTPQGLIFRDTIQTILLAYSGSLRQCRASLEETQKLSFCYAGHFNQQVLPPVIRKFRESFPECEIYSQRIRGNELRSALETKSIAFVLTPEHLLNPADQTIHFFHLYNDRHYCVMNRRNPLAEKASIGLGDLAGKTLLMPASDITPAHMVPVIGALSDPDLGCRFGNGQNSDNAILQLITSESSIAIMTGYTKPFHPDLTALPLNSGVEIPVGLAYIHPLSDLEQTFADLARRILARV